ncbi:MAG: ABC transporter permease [Proteobacteria bacterium]|nr:ABC transporter permease [Pseudomonadota bacterium]
MVNSGARYAGALSLVRRHPTIFIGGIVLLAIALMAALAPHVGTVDPRAIDPAVRLRSASSQHWMGTDMLGRDLYSRVVYGGRMSLVIGLGVALLAAGSGLLIGVVTGFNRRIDAIVMRVMDGLMAIPSVLLAIALMALTRASIENVLFAITIAEIPRVVRLVRGVVLTLRGQPFIEAATACGTRTLPMLWRHILPNTIAPVLVQATYICASAMLIEATLSFIGAGIPPGTPSWGNIMAEGRTVFQLSPATILYPGMMLSLTVLSVNLLGDGLRDAFDPRLSRLM